MRKTLTILGFLAVFPAGVAHGGRRLLRADGRLAAARRRCRDWPRSNGWTVRRIKIDDGCYEIDGRDAEGRQIEVTVHPATLQVIEFEYEDEDDGDRPRRDREGGDND